MPMRSFLVACMATYFGYGTSGRATNIPKNSNRRIPPFVKNLEEVSGCSLALFLEILIINQL